MSDRIPTPNPGRGLTWAMDEDDEPIIRRDPHFENLIAQLIPRRNDQQVALFEIVNQSGSEVMLRPMDAEGMEPFGAKAMSRLQAIDGDIAMAIRVADTWYVLDTVSDIPFGGFGLRGFGEEPFGGEG